MQGELDASAQLLELQCQARGAGLSRAGRAAQEAAEALGATGDISAIGYVFNEEWANEHKDAMLGFVKASRAGEGAAGDVRRGMGAASPADERIDDDAVFKNTVKRFREGIPNRPIAEEEARHRQGLRCAREARRRGARRQGDDHVARNVLAGPQGRLVSLRGEERADCARHQSEVTAPYAVRIDAEDLSAGDRRRRRRHPRPRLRACAARPSPA